MVSKTLLSAGSPRILVIEYKYAKLGYQFQKARKSQEVCHRDRILALFFLLYINELPNCLDDTNLTVNGATTCEIQEKLKTDLKDIGNQNFYYLYLLGILTEYLISYFSRFVAFSC